MSDIDPIEFGRMVGAVESLVIHVEHMAKEIDCIRNQLSKGKGIVIGMIFAAGGIGAGATHLMEKVLGHG